MEDRTVTLSGLGKTYAVTGWRVGWAVAAAPLTALVRKVHDYLTICAPTAFQEAGCAALALPDALLRGAAAERMPAAARSSSTPSDAPGFAFAAPEGAYYVMVDARAARLEGRLRASSTSSPARSA